MPRYRADENLPYFCTLTVRDWIPIFIDSRYIDPLIEYYGAVRAERQRYREWTAAVGAT